MFLYIQTLPEEGLEIGKAFIWCGGTEGIMDLQLATKDPRSPQLQNAANHSFLWKVLSGRVSYCQAPPLLMEYSFIWSKLSSLCRHGSD